MSDLETSIVIHDKIPDSIIKKLKDIEANTDRSAIAQNKAAISAERLAQAQIKTAVQVERLNQAQNRTNQTVTQSEIRHQQLIAAQNRAVASQLRLQQQTARTSSRFNLQASAIGNLAKQLLIVSGIGFSSHALVSTIDTYQKMINRLQLISESGEIAKQRLASLTQVATNSYSPIESVAQLYTRLDLSLRQIGGSASEAIQITETLSKATSLAGLSLSEQSAALLQISQAFNKGKLDGDEFRTVMETMPPVADAIANRLNVARGALLDLAPKGVITAQVMKEALLDMGEEIDRRFSKLTPTIEQQFTNIRTEAGIFFGSLFQNTDFGRGINTALKSVSDNLGIITKSAVIVGTSIVTAFSVVKVIAFVNALRSAVTTMGLLASVTGTFSKILKTSPIGLVTTGITALGLGIDFLYEKVTGRSLFPSFDQDSLKAQDYINRLKEINNQLDKISTTKVAQLLLQNAQAQNEHAKSLENEKKELADLNKQLEMQARLRQHLIEIQSSKTSAVDLLFYNNEADVIERLIVSEEEYLNMKVRAANLQESVAKSEQDSIELKKQELALLTKRRDAYEKAVDILKDKTEEDIRSNKTLQIQQDIINDTKKNFADLEQRINATTNALKKLGVVDFTPIVDKANAKADEQIAAASYQKYQTLLAKSNFKKQGIGLKGEALFKYNAIADLEKDAAELKTITTTGRKIDDKKPLKNGEKTAYDALIKEKIEVQRLENAHRERGKASQKAYRSEETGASQAAKRLQKAKDSYGSYLDSIKRENELLQVGYDEYTNYKDLYRNIYEWRQKGLKISEDEIKSLREQIDANKLLREELERRKEVEDNALSKRTGDFNDKINAITNANLSNGDRAYAANELANSIQGVDTTGSQTYYDALIAQNNEAYAQIKALRDANFIDEQQAWALRAQVWANSQTQMIQPVANALGIISDLQKSQIKGLAKVGKAAAIAQAIMNTYTSATAAYASAAAVPYVGYILAPIAAGAAITAGLANVAAIRSQDTGYKSGGFTGFGSVNNVAGQLDVHGQEYVFDSNSTRSQGVENLEALRNGTAYIRHKADDIQNNSTSSNVSVNIENYGTNKNFEVQNDGGNIRIVARDVLNEIGQDIVRNYMQSDDGQEIIAKTARRNS